MRCTTQLMSLKTQQFLKKYWNLGNHHHLVFQGSSAMASASWHWFLNLEDHVHSAPLFGRRSWQEAANFLGIGKNPAVQEHPVDGCDEYGQSRAEAISDKEFFLFRGVNKLFKIDDLPCIVGWVIACCWSLAPWRFPAFSWKLEMNREWRCWKCRTSWS